MIKERRREIETLNIFKLYILENPKTAKEKQQNKETYKIAESILATRQADFIRGKFDLQDNTSIGDKLYS